MESFNSKYTEALRLAMCNFITDMDRLKRFAIGHGFAGIGWLYCAGPVAGGG